MKNLEIERRFLLYPCSVKRFLRNAKIEYESVPIKQVYMPYVENGIVRFRQIGDKYVRTYKNGIGLVREEEEHAVSKEEFLEAVAQNREKMIKKRRYIFSIGDSTFELDRFKGALKGLNILEIEFKNIESAKAFILPDIFSKILIDEVTKYPEFSNNKLYKTMRIPFIDGDLKEILKRIKSSGSFLKASASVDIKPFEPASSAVKAVMFKLLLCVKANRDAILKSQKDPERLHQFRVALRKIRALLGQLQDIFDPIWDTVHRGNLVNIMRATNDKRDIDVYLSQIDSYKKMLPKRLESGIDTLQEYLISQDKKQTKILFDLLKSDLLSNEINELDAFCHDLYANGLSPDSSIPILIRVKKALVCRYDRIVKMGHTIKENSSAAHYHRLRIEVKKIRYMMEFFSSLLDPDSYLKMVKIVKECQTVLGEHQDLVVQRDHLKAFSQLKQLHEKHVLEAIEKLRKEMAYMEKKKRLEFLEIFKAFDSSKSVFKTMICKF